MTLQDAMSHGKTIPIDVVYSYIHKLQDGEPMGDPHIQLTVGAVWSRISGAIHSKTKVHKVWREALNDLKDWVGAEETRDLFEVVFAD